MDVILMTACIAPGNMTNTVLLDSDIRKKQYIKAINFYLTNTSLPIVFVDNSNIDLSSLFQQEVDNERIEFITFDGNNFNPELGKGYGEGLIVQHALAKSKILNQASRVIKVTGRLIIRNINDHIQQAKKINFTYANRMKDRYGELMCHSYFFITLLSSLLNFSNNIFRINESEHRYFEHILYQTICKKNIEFIEPIILEGMSGTSGITYRHTNIDYLKAFLNYWLHKVGIYQETFLPKLKNIIKF